MKPQTIVLVACIAFFPLQGAAASQILTNPGGLPGGPTVPGPVGGLSGPSGGGPSLEPIKIDLNPTLPSVPSPTVKTDPTGSSGGSQSQTPKLPKPPSPPREPPPDGDVETPDLSGGRPTVDLPLPSAGRGGNEPSVPPTSSDSGSGFSWWIVVGIGLLVVVLFGASRGGKG